MVIPRHHKVRSYDLDGKVRTSAKSGSWGGGGHVGFE